MGLEWSKKMPEEALEYLRTSNDAFLDEWEKSTFWASFVGNQGDDRALIYWTNEKSRIQTFEFEYSEDPTLVGPYGNIPGSEKRLFYANDVVEAKFSSISSIIDNKFITESSYTNKFSYLDRAKKSLLKDREKATPYQYLQCLTEIILPEIANYVYPKEGNTPYVLNDVNFKLLAQKIPTIRIVDTFNPDPALVGIQQIARSRIIGGSNDKNLNATTIAELCANLTPNTNDGMNCQGIMLADEIADEGGRRELGFLEVPISPAKEENGSSIRTMLMHPNAYRSQLLKDPDCNNQLDRGMREHSYQPTIYGNTQYKGRIGGCDIITWPLLKLLEFESGGQRFAINFIIGASHMVYWEMMSRIVPEYENGEKTVRFIHHEDKALKALQPISQNGNNFRRGKEGMSKLRVPSGILIFITPLGEKTNINDVRIVEQPIRTQAAAEARSLDVNTVASSLGKASDTINNTETTNKK